MKKKCLRVISLLLAVVIFVNPLVSVAVAENDTGDASASAESQNDVNVNITESPGSIDVNDCTVTGSGNCDLSNDNTATLSAQTTAVATTGTNIDADVTTTGDATASGTSKNNVNDNQLLLVPGSESTESGEISFNNENKADVSDTTNVIAESGNNLGGAKIDTGNVDASANILNLINTNLLGSLYQFSFTDVYDGSGDINFYADWLELTSQIIDSSGNLKLTAISTNSAVLDEKVTVLADSGQNQATVSGSANINTGDANALANILNLVNTNVLGSHFIFGVINIFGNYSGNIILPSREDMDQNNSGITPAIQNLNSATISGELTSGADSGHNLGASTTTTGQARSQANASNFVNTNLFGSNWSLLMLNNLGQFSGKVLSFSNPNESQEVTDSSKTLSYMSQNESLTATGEAKIENYNDAIVDYKVDVKARTGDNFIDATGSGSTINTGNAKSLANLVNIVNTNIVGSNWLFGIVNIFGNFSGNIIYAYPNLKVTATRDRDSVVPGEEVNYTITYSNEGYKEAKDVSIKIDLPNGVVGQSNFFIGNVPAHTSGNFILKLKVDPNFLNISTQAKANFWDFLIKPVFAAEKNLVVTGSIVNSNGNANTNNTFMDVVNVVEKTSQSSNTVLPKFLIESKNNVGEYVNPNDIVTYDVKVKNSGEGEARDAKLIIELFSPNEESLGQTEIPIATLPSQKEASLSFGMPVPASLISGTYFTKIYFEGMGDDNNKYYSQSIKNLIPVRGFVPLGEEPQEIKEGQVLGVTNAQPLPVLTHHTNYWPYFFIILGCLFLLKRFLSRVRMISNANSRITTSLFHTKRVE